MKNFDIEIVLCIDSTGSMGPYFERTKKVINDYEKLLEEYRSKLNSFRIQVISFGDYYDGPDAVKKSRFFDLFKEKDELIEHIDNIEYIGKGADIPENGLEALYEAVETEWTPKNKESLNRKIIIIISDAPPLELQERADVLGYPDYYPKDLKELETIYNEKFADKYYGKLLLIVPTDTSWNEVYDFKNVLLYDIEEFGYKFLKVPFYRLFCKRFQKTPYF